MELWADGTARLTIRKGKNQIEPQTVAGTATARALGEIRPGQPDPAAPVFELTGETLTNRVRGRQGPPALVTVLWTQRPHRNGPPDGSGRNAQRSSAAPGQMEARRHGGPEHQGGSGG